MQNSFEKIPLEGEYQSRNELFDGMIFSTKEGMEKWCRITGKIPYSIQNGTHNIIGITGWYVQYEK